MSPAASYFSSYLLFLLLFFFFLTCRKFSPLELKGEKNAKPNTTAVYDENICLEFYVIEIHEFCAPIYNSGLHFHASLVRATSYRWKTFSLFL